MTRLAKLVLCFISDHPGITASRVADHFKIENRTYGRQRPINTAIAELRRVGLLEDVPRCKHCHRALTRGIPNRALRVTLDGAAAMAEWRAA